MVTRIMKMKMKKQISFPKSLFLLTMMKKKKSPTAPLIALKKKKRTCDFYLPDDCWEHVFTFLINTSCGDKNKLHFKSLSLVSKHFLFIANRLLFSLKIYYPQLCSLPRYFHRFSNLNSLDLWFGSHDLQDGIDFSRINLSLCDRPTLIPHDLDVARIALDLRDRPTLKSLSFVWIELNDANTSHYIDSFLSFKCLNCLKFRRSQISDDLLYSIARQGLPLKTFVLEICTGYSYHGIYDLISKCRGIQHLGLQGVDFLNNHHVSQLFLLLPDLVSVNLSRCSMLKESALFALIKNCHSLVEITIESIYIDEITMEDIYIERECVENFVVNPRLKFLRLAHNSFINDETIIVFASIFPNLQLLDLSYCFGLSKKGICQVLRRCCKVRHLKLNYLKLRGLKMNFVVHHLKVLELSMTSVNDKTLYEISKSCCGLLQLLLVCCDYITEKGVMRVVENCTQLKKIDLSCCRKVKVDDVVAMLSSMPSLRKDNRSTRIARYGGFLEF